MQNDYAKNESPTVQVLAVEMLKHQVRITRENGDQIVALKDDAPDWMQDLIRDAHGGSLPDDQTYEFVFEALEAIRDSDDEDSARDSIEADTYNRDLITWLASSLSRAQYVNEAVAEYGALESFDLFQTLQMGQVKEKTETFDLVLQGLETRLDEVEAA